MMDYAVWKRGIGSGVVAGIVWGWLAMIIHAVTKISPVEHSILYNMFPFTIGGVIIGILSGGLLALIHDRLPFRSWRSTPARRRARQGGLRAVRFPHAQSIDSGRYH